MNVSGIIFAFLIARPEKPSVKAEKWRRNSAAMGGYRPSGSAGDKECVSVGVHWYGRIRIPQ